MVVIPACFEVTLKELKGVYSDGDPPLPIPNREVKPVSADGTAPGWESRSMPDLEGESIKTRPFFILSRGELVTCQLVTFQLSIVFISPGTTRGTGGMPVERFFLSPVKGSLSFPGSGIDPSREPGVGKSRVRRERDGVIRPRASLDALPNLGQLYPFYLPVQA